VMQNIIMDDLTAQLYLPGTRRKNTGLIAACSASTPFHLPSTNF
jgi:hypothetical protein